MELIIGGIGLLVVLLIVGLLFRTKGDGALDTIGAGCKGMLVLVFIVIAVVIFVILMNS
jgi:hypothetical protein